MLKEPALSGLGREHLVRVLSDRLQLRLHPLDSAKLRRPRALLARGKAFDLAFELEGVGQRRRLYVEVKPRLLRQDIDAFHAQSRELRQVDRGAVPLLMVPHLSRRNREELRGAGVNHADLRGVLFIRNSGLYVDLEGTEPESSWPSLHGLYRGNRVNPFADKASFVLRALFDSPRRAWRVIDVSAQAHLTKGWVSLVAAELVQRGYVERLDAGLRLVNPVSVLNDWNAVYSWRRNRMESYVAPFDYQDLRSKVSTMLGRLKSEWAFTLLAGADEVAPHVQHGQLHAYVGAADFGQARSALRESLHLEPVAQGGNLHLLEPYYSKSAFYGCRSVGDINVVSDLQLYLDLAEYPVRGAEAAAMLLRTRLGPALGLDASQLAELV